MKHLIFKKQQQNVESLTHIFVSVINYLIHIMFDKYIVIVLCICIIDVLVHGSYISV